MNLGLIYVVIIVLAVEYCGGQISHCEESVASVTFVAACPTSKEERDTAARKKNCNETATEQTCAPSEKFKYHCVINGYGNALLEVCALERIILGHCTEFNLIGGVIQDHQSMPCNNESFPKCDRFYFSSDAYKYPDCYHLVRDTRKPSKTPTIDKMLIIAAVATVVILIVIVTGVWWKVKSKKKNKNTDGQKRIKYGHNNSQQRDSKEVIILPESDSSLKDQRLPLACHYFADFHADNGTSNPAKNKEHPLIVTTQINSQQV